MSRKTHIYNLPYSFENLAILNIKRDKLWDSLDELVIMFSLFLDISCDVCTQVLKELEMMLPKEASTFISDVCISDTNCGSDQSVSHTLQAYY